MSIKCTIFLYASCSDCSLQSNIINCNPCGYIFSGCNLCDLGFNLACLVHRTICTDSILWDMTWKWKTSTWSALEWHHASVVLAQQITNLEILLKSASSFLVWRHELQRIDRGAQMWRSGNRTCRIEGNNVVDYCICYHLPVWHVSKSAVYINNTTDLIARHGFFDYCYLRY